MKVLLDTNIIIHREANKIIRDDIGHLFRWLDKLKYEKRRKCWKKADLMLQFEINLMNFLLKNKNI